MCSFLSDTFFKSFSNKYFYVEAATNDGILLPLLLILSRVYCTMYILTPTLVGSLKMNTTLEYSTRVVQEGDRRCKKSTLNDLAYLTPLRIPLMNPVMFVISWFA
jgi:hypothetical protein